MFTIDLFFVDFRISDFVKILSFGVQTIMRGGLAIVNNIGCEKVFWFIINKIRLYKSLAREPWLNGSPRACT